MLKSHSSDNKTQKKVCSLLYLIVDRELHDVYVT